MNDKIVRHDVPASEVRPGVFAQHTYLEPDPRRVKEVFEGGFVTLELGEAVIGPVPVGNYEFYSIEIVPEPRPMPKQKQRALEYDCPACQAQIGEPCTSPTDTGRREVRWFHFARTDQLDG